MFLLGPFSLAGPPGAGSTSRPNGTLSFAPESGLRDGRRRSCPAGRQLLVRRCGAADAVGEYAHAAECFGRIAANTLAEVEMRLRFLLDLK